MRVLLPILVFLVAAGGIVGAYAAVAYLPGVMLRRRIIQRMTADAPERSTIGGIVKLDTAGPLAALDRLSRLMAPGRWLGRHIEQAGLTIGVGQFILACCVFGLLGALAARTIPLPWMWAAGLAVGGATPVLWLRMLRSKRLRRFEEQFPEALDLLSRAIRAGHAFSTAMGMAADELPDPAGTEFRRAFDHQNFGLPMKDALGSMIERVPSLDVRFFVTAVLIQRETGGNLSEILDNLARVVRERFKVMRQVRVHTAHGRFTGYVLMALPAALGVALSTLNREHMRTLFHEPLGQKLIAAAIFLQFVGYLWIRRVVKVEV